MQIYFFRKIFWYFTDDIEWPDSEDWTVQDEAKNLITVLLNHTPRDRLGTGGAQEVKEHIYFNGLDWNSLLRQKAEFVPQLDNDEDTSYFDSRIDRYNHDLEDDTDDTDDSPVFGLFSSCSPQYKKVHSSRLNSTADLDTSTDSIRITTSVATTPDTPENPDLKVRLRSNIFEKDSTDVVPIEHKKVLFIYFHVLFNSVYVSIHFFL